MPQVHILLVNTKVPRSTKKMVAGVRNLHTKVKQIIQGGGGRVIVSLQYPTIVGPVMDSIEAITQRAEQLLDSLASLSSTSPAPSPEAPTEDPSAERVKIHSGLQVCGGSACTEISISTPSFILASFCAYLLILLQSRS